MPTPTPVVAATYPGLGAVHPSQYITTFLANISPKPSMTPLTKGKSKLMASDEKRAFTRVRVDKDASKIASVAVAGAGWCGEGRGCKGEGVSVRSGKDTDGRDDTTEGMSSHFWDSVS